MAKLPPEEYTKFTISDIDLMNLQGYTKKDFDAVIAKLQRASKSSVGIEGLSDVVARYIDEQTGATVAEIITKATRKTNVTDSIKKQLAAMNTKVKDTVTGASYDYTVDKDIMYKVTKYKTATSKEALRQLQENAENLYGASVMKAPTKSNPDRYKITYLSEYDPTDPNTSKLRSAEARALTAGHLNKINQTEYDRRDAEAKAIEAKEQEKLRKEQEKLRKEQERKDAAGARAEERRKRDDERKQEKADKEEEAERRRTNSIIKKVLSGILLLADITRRILTSVMKMAVADSNLAQQAGGIGMSLYNAKRNAYADVAHGLTEGTNTGAVQDVQNLFGDVTNLDTAALYTLSRIIGSSIDEEVNSGMGGSKPELLVEHILDAFMNNIIQGKNSLGQNVGYDAAERELVTVLNKISPNLGAILNKMAEEYATGVHKGEASTYKEWLYLTRTGTAQTGAEEEHIAEIGQTLKEINAQYKIVLDQIKGNILQGLSGIINSIANIRAAYSAQENLDKDAKNRNLNLKAASNLRGQQEYAKQNMTENLRKLGYSETEINNITNADFDTIGGANAKTYSEWEKLYTSELATGHPDPNKMKLYTKNMAITKLEDMLTSTSGEDIDELRADFLSYITLGISADEAEKEAAKKNKVGYDASDYTTAGVSAHTQLIANALFGNKGEATLKHIREVQGNKNLSFSTDELSFMYGLAGEYIARSGGSLEKLAGSDGLIKAIYNNSTKFIGNGVIPQSAIDAYKANNMTDFLGAIKESVGDKFNDLVAVAFADLLTGRGGDDRDLARTILAAQYESYDTDIEASNYTREALKTNQAAIQSAIANTLAKGIIKQSDLSNVVVTGTGVKGEDNFHITIDVKSGNKTVNVFDGSVRANMKNDVSVSHEVDLSQMAADATNPAGSN